MELVSQYNNSNNDTLCIIFYSALYSFRVASLQESRIAITFFAMMWRIQLP
jgi:hypothetical protein